MRVIALSTIRKFIEAKAENAAAAQSLMAWYQEAMAATWTQPADIKAQFRSASILKGGRVVFNIKGNNFRLIVSVSYSRGIVFLKFIGTHKEYDDIDPETVELE